MFGLILVAAVATWALWTKIPSTVAEADLTQRISTKLDRLWDIAQESLKERKYLRAEKALLTILRVDERNATAYNRLGILYAKQQAFDDAIECFEIAQSLEPSASSLHNVGLIYYETEKYDKAALAFEQALAMEDDHASRHIAYAKVLEKLGQDKKMLASLEKAAALEPSVQSYHILADAYDRLGMLEHATSVREKIQRAVASSGPTPRQIHQVRKVNL